ncbi:MAG: hypothetical protein IJQ20_05505 [Paludibacteraceae bacterium]|nr:hypothetical protein [Paludibacteraceae bacterium]
MEIIMQPGAELQGTLNRKHGYSIQCRRGRFFSKRNNNWRNCPPDGLLNFIRCLTRMAGGSFVADIIITDVELNYALVMAVDKGIEYHGNFLHAGDVRAILDERNLL